MPLFRTIFRLILSVRVAAKTRTLVSVEVPCSVIRASLWLLSSSGGIQLPYGSAYNGYARAHDCRKCKERSKRESRFRTLKYARSKD